MVVQVGLVNVQCLSRKLVRNLGDWMAGERLSVEVLCVEVLPLFVPEHGQLLTGGSESSEAQMLAFPEEWLMDTADMIWPPTWKC